MSSGLRAPNALLQKTLAPLISDAKKFAIVSCGNMQYKVSVGDVIAVQRLRADIGSQIALKKVHMVGGERFTAIGRPLLEGCRVVADVEEQKRMRSVVSFFAPHGMRKSRLLENQHAATVLRIREIVYEPEVVGELDKYEGVLQDPKSFSPSKSPNRTYWVEEPKAEHGSAFLDNM
mmetsp:Transcript_28422/g.32866  ORF Transcript_28422/g.32866 Transcript_28422/m.32866 type:complete len:176 (-) Transcript_28422:51-578(-)|eukprot:CAMPEP_0176450406 /NCGR_PEP_ID=MMETSP0127-20121128/27129_1 /TAXON_ID=938130 /ORGANISM="Platyophrya macrostoma, Strain WH" /LENGTH=175 /DNA_ID=CAMNT_0017838079 /DNA_START=61 /DNA_END=588 /DNA_ORIENTATION=-